MPISAEDFLLRRLTRTATPKMLFEFLQMDRGEELGAAIFAFLKDIVPRKGQEFADRLLSLQLEASAEGTINRELLHFIQSADEPPAYTGKVLELILQKADAEFDRAVLSTLKHGYMHSLFYCCRESWLIAVRLRYQQFPIIEEVIDRYFTLNRFAIRNDPFDI